MPFSVYAFSESQDSAALIEAAPIADQHATITGDDLFTIPFNQLLGYHAMGANFTIGQLASPSLRTLFNIDIEGADLTDEPGSPPNVHDRFESPIPLAAGEGLRFLMAEDAMGASRVTCLVWLGDGPGAPSPEGITTVRATGTTTLTANAWTAVTLTFSQTLPAGSYEVLGARFNSAGCRAGRLILPGQNHRPGAPGVDADSDIEHPRFRYGRAGVWGTFTNVAVPQAEFFSASADTSEVVHLDVRKVA